MIQQEKEIQESVETRIKEVLPTFSKLSYISSIEKNNFRNQSNRFGTLVKTTTQVSGTVSHLTFDTIYEIILTTQFFETNIDESKKAEASLYLRGNIYSLFKDLVKSKAGLQSKVMNVNELSMEEPEFLEESKVVIQRANITITHRISLL